MNDFKRTSKNKPHGWAWEWEEGLEDSGEDENEETDERGTEGTSDRDASGKKDKK